MKLENEVRWKGKLAPTFTLPGTAPMPLTSASVRRTIQGFLETGQSNHSAQGGTLWALLDYLQGKKIPYTLQAYPGFGYCVKRADGVNS